MTQTIYKLLKANKKIALSLYKTLVNTKGLWCTVYEPVEQNSIFGLEDLVEYDEFVKDRKRLLVYGLFQEGEVGMEGYDSFVEGCYILTPYSEMIPQQSKVRIEFCGRTFTMKVDTHHNLLPSVCEQLFVKNMLVAAT